MPDRESDQIALFSPLIELAVELSAQWHDGTYRKSRWREEPFDAPGNEFLGVPVHAHVTFVGLLVQRAGWDDVTIAAAFVHDVIEDANRFGSELTPQDLAGAIGPAVTERVLEVTEQKYDTAGKHRAWRPRKEDYIKNLAGASDGAIAISLADKLHNCWSMNEALEKGVNIFEDDQNRKRLSAGPEQQIWFFREVLSVSERRSVCRLDDLRELLQNEVDRFEILTSV